MPQRDPVILAALARELDRLQISDEFGCTPLGTDGHLVLLDGNLDCSHAVYVATDLLTALRTCPDSLTYAEFWDILRPWRVEWLDTVNT